MTHGMIFTIYHSNEIMLTISAFWATKFFNSLKSWLVIFGFKVTETFKGLWCFIFYPYSYGTKPVAYQLVCVIFVSGIKTLVAAEKQALKSDEKLNHFHIFLCQKML